MPVGAIIGAGSSLVSGLLGSNAAGNAAKVQAQNAEKARQTIQQGQNQARDFQSGVWSGTQNAEKPYQTVGSTSANNLVNLLSKGFTAPTLQDAQNTPGFQFRMQQGTNAINQNAAANGTLFSGNTGTALEQYGQNLANTAYQQDYNNALSTYNANYQSLLGGTDVGLNSTAQLANAGQAAAQNMTGIDLGGANLQAQQINNAAAARASGYLGKNQALQGTIGGVQAGLQDWLNPGQQQPNVLTAYDPSQWVNSGTPSVSAPMIPGVNSF